MPACAQYDSDESLVIAAPTGSGKTGVLELALARLFGNGTIAGGGRALAVYMAPLKALCHERLLDWQHKLHPLVVVELTGDSADESADERTVAAADLIVTTPEKWDSFTRFRRDAQGVLGRLAVLLVDEAAGDELRLVVQPWRLLGVEPDLHPAAVGAEPHGADLGGHQGPGQLADLLEEGQFHRATLPPTGPRREVRERVHEFVSVW